MKVYSFYDPPKEERFRDHVVAALSAIGGGRLISEGLRIDSKFKYLLQVSVAFHDFGKIPFNRYKFSPGRRLSFEGHEVISAWAVHRYLRGQGNVNGIESMVVELSVLLHHHPMNLQRRLRALRGENRLRVGREDFELFYSELEGVVRRGWEQEREIEASEVAGEVERRLGEMWREVWMNGGPKLRRLFLLNLQGLVAADYHSASINRGGSTEFGDVVGKFLANFMR